MSRNDWIILIVALIMYQAFTTVLVLQSDDFDDDVKLKQIITVWLIPIVGALLVRVSLNDARRKRLEREAAKSRDQETGGST